MDQDKLIAEINATASALARENPSPGIAITIVKQGRVVVTRGYGVANVEHDVPVTPKTVFEIGSLTKQFTAAAVLRLRDEGRLGLDAAISRYLKTLPSYMSDITVRQLLNHTSGIVNYTELGDKFAALEREEISHVQMLGLLSREPLDFKPGAAHKYSNSGYYLLGMIIEQVSKRTYADFLEDIFFRPLGMHATTYCSSRKIIKNRSSGYDASTDAKGLSHAPYISMTAPFAAGALCSTVKDLSIWVDALTSGKALASESFGEMTTPARLNDGSEQLYGFGLMLEVTNSLKKFVHNGGIPGFSSILSHYPDQKLTVVILTNSNSGNLWEMEEALGSLAVRLEVQSK